MLSRDEGGDQTTGPDFGCIHWADKTASVSSNGPDHGESAQEDPPGFPGTKRLTKEHLIRVMGEEGAARLFKQLGI